MNSARLIASFISALSLSLFSASNAQSWNDTLSVVLDSVVIQNYSNTSGIKQRSDGTFVWSMKKLVDMPKILGNSDPVHFAQMLPGIQTNSEFRCGINIEGCDNSHNIVTLGEVPVYNASHLLGFFSVFNASHYSTMNVSKIPQSAASAGRIGGTLSFVPFYEKMDSLCGEASVGLISSQATVHANMGKKTHVTMSLRGSYMNLLYGKWLQADGNDIKYSFFDTNFTLVHKIKENNLLAFDFYGGSDDAKFSDSGYLASIRGVWGNYTGALHWLNDINELHLHSIVYVSAYKNRFQMNMQDMIARLPSSIIDFGLKSRLKWRRWNLGAEMSMYNIQPQNVEVSGNVKINTIEQLPQKPVEGAIYADYMIPFGSYFNVDIGIRTSMFHNMKKTFVAVDPSFFVYYSNNQGLQLQAGYSMRHQYMYLTGFSDAGLPTEFWMPTDTCSRPQYAHCTTIGGSFFTFGRKYRFSADIFYRCLYNQTEYSGNIFDLISSSYDYSSAILRGDGENYGISFMAQKCGGRLTGWVSYTFTKAHRRFVVDGKLGAYPANHERPHELNIVANYSFSRHWSFGATVVYASGTPFTAPASVEIINGNIIAKYGEHNANRLADYMRMDLSVNYKWQMKRGIEYGINLSIYNALARRNDLFYRLKVNKKKEYGYRPMRFELALMPSVSYFCRF